MLIEPRLEDTRGRMLVEVQDKTGFVVAFGKANGEGCPTGRIAGGEHEGSI